MLSTLLRQTEQPTEEYVANDTSPHRHTAQDTAATVKQSYLQAGTKLVAQVIMNEL